VAFKFDSLIHTGRKVYFVRPHGIKVRFWRKGIIRPSDLAIDMIRALIHFLDVVHEAGYTFDGQLSGDNLYWLPDSKAVKIWGLISGVMVKKTDEGMRSDFACIHDLIRDRIFPGSRIPTELEHLMRLMKSDPIRYANLIKYNICLLDDENKVGKYIILFQKLQAKKLDENIYREALKKLKCGKCVKENWQKDILYHDALVSVFDYDEHKRIPADEEGVSLWASLLQSFAEVFI
jgi:hydrogenase maturation factor